MALWEYKVITSGKGGFATPALLETYLNQLGTDEWEIIEFRAQPDNPLAFHGLARRPTQRDWTLEAAATAAAKAEADKLRAEFAAKFQAATSGTAGSTEPAAPGAEAGEPARDDSFRPLRDTEHDLEPGALDDSTPEEPEEWPAEDQLPSFFEAIRPHMRRNQKGPGYSVSVDYLVKKFEMIESDLIAALKECGFPLPEDEDEKPVYLEYDGDIYWVNVNRRGELWINTREKPRPVFKVTKGTPLAPEAAEQKAEGGERNAESAGTSNPPAHEQSHRSGERNRRRDGRRQRGEERGQPASPSAPASAPASETPPAAAGEKSEAAATPAALPAGPELLNKLRPLMRRSRGGWSGTISFLSRALRCSDADLSAALAALGLQLPANGGEKPPTVEVGELAYWLNKDGRGGVWINVRERKEGEKAESGERKAESGETPATASATAPLVPAATAPAEVPVAEPSVATPTPIEAKPEQLAPVALSSSPLAAVRLLLKETKPGSFSGVISFLARSLEKSEEDLVGVLVGAGLKVPEKAREKPVFAEHAGEIFWFNKNAKGELWLNAKASKFAGQKSDAADAPKTDEAQEKKPRRGGRTRKSNE